eukprot:363369-Chlamydomonas_euryale.AAC.19
MRTCTWRKPAHPRTRAPPTHTLIPRACTCARPLVQPLAASIAPAHTLIPRACTRARLLVQPLDRQHRRLQLARAALGVARRVYSLAVARVEVALAAQKAWHQEVE